jgi:CRISPR/Cas system-associated exonuclease Cas4 (RecB family)
VVEEFYNKKLYLQGKKAWETLRQILEQQYATVLSSYRLNVPVEEQAAYLEEIWVATKNYVNLIIDNLVIGEEARSEVAFYGMPVGNSGNGISGKVDIIVKRQGRVLVVDGKGTKRGRNALDPRQLLFYATLYHARYHTYPNSIAFLLYLMDDYYEIPLEPSALDGLLQEIDTTFSRIKAGDFLATPSEDCYFCPYKTLCPEYFESQLSKRLDIIHENTITPPSKFFE